MKKLLIASVTCLSTLFIPISAYSESVVASWNLMRLGHGDKKNYEALAVVASHFDVISVQEVMTEEGFSEMISQMNNAGGSWEGMISTAKGRYSYKEFYGFIWRTDRIVSVENAISYLDPGDLFEREPFAATFTDVDGLRYVMTSAHSIYGDSQDRREAEAIALSEYYQWLQASFPGIPVLMAGDFNLKPSNPAWSAMKGISRPSITDGATTLSTIDGKFANLYDNIWVPLSAGLHGSSISEAGIFDFPSFLEITHEDARSSVSDHAPVWVRIR